MIQLINPTSSGGGAWGTITGTLSSQTDLQNALNGLVPYTGDTAVKTWTYGQSTDVSTGTAGEFSNSASGTQMSICDDEYNLNDGHFTVYPGGLVQTDNLIRSADYQFAVGSTKPTGYIKNNSGGSWSIDSRSLIDRSGISAGTGISYNSSTGVITNAGGTVTSVATSSPLTGGTITGSGTIGITKADTTHDGYLAQTDFSSFNNSRTSSVVVQIRRTDGNAIQAGDSSFIIVPYAGTITGWKLLSASNGSIVLDVWKQAFTSGMPTVTNTITAANYPTLAGALSNSDNTLSGWTTSVSAGDILKFYINSASAVTQVLLIVNIQRA